MSVHTVVPVVQLEQSEITLRRSLFDDLDRRAREIEKQWKSTWVELADLCATIRGSELWRDGGYESFGSWLKNACPTSRSMAYLAMGIREELTEMSAEDLRQIPLGNAKILQDTPRIRRNGHLIEAAKAQPPREFIGTVIEQAPDAHLEQKQVHKFRMTTSASKTLQAGLDMWRLLNDDPEAPPETSLEGIVSDFMLTHQEEFERKVRACRA